MEQPQGHTEPRGGHHAQTHTHKEQQESPSQAMDNPQANGSGFFSMLKKPHSFSSSSTDLTSLNKHDDPTPQDTIPVPAPRHRHRISTSYFAKHMKMTPLDTSSTRTPRLQPKGPSHADAVKQSYKRECERWFVSKRLNQHEKEKDPYTFSGPRLDGFLQMYDTFLQGMPMDTPAMFEKRDRVGFWSCQALKYLSGVSQTLTLDVFADFSNNELKKKEKMKVMCLMSDDFVTQWSWQLGIDNPQSQFYCYSLCPSLYTAISEYKSTIAPSNYHILHGDSLSNIPFSKESFSSAVAYDLWLHLKEDEWVPVLAETYRLLAQHGQMSLFMMDFTLLNCTSEIYMYFFGKVQDVLRREGIDPFPCRRIQQRLVDAGFDKPRYAFLSLAKGQPGNLGATMELVQGFFEYVIFTRVAEMGLTDEETEIFREMKLQYNRDCRNGELLRDFGDSYYMFLMAEKK